MTKRIRAKHKIDRRLGENIWGRPKSPLNKRESRPGQHGERRSGKLSDFGQQLRAKQKLKGYYGNISERHFRRLYAEANRIKGSTSENLIALLERRLDAVVYRAKFVPTVFAARQFISHGHVKVNGRKVDISSYRVRPGDEIEVREKARQIPMVLEAIQSGERDVPDYITAERLRTVLNILEQDLRDKFGIPEPHIVVCGLNPHAGEGGLFGDEETQFIVPAIETARLEGIDASGPHSADTLFWFAAQGRYDAVICMYHDQGLIPLKLLHFDDGVNVTLGLPIVRTSVDHGTAFDIAGKGKADPGSLLAAVDLAATLAVR